MTGVEFLGGLFSHSLALVSDSGHVLTDVFVIGLSILTIRLGRKPHTSRRTFGYHRAEIFAAFLNGSALLIIALLVMYEAYRRLLQPPQVQVPLLLVVAFVGLLGNIAMAQLLRAGRQASLNVRSAFLHAVGDTLSSVGVIVSGVVVTVTGYNAVDPLVAILIGVLILRNAFALVRESTDILMEATPKHLSLEEISKTILAVQGVRGVHDLHVWTITSGLYAVSGHLAVDSDSIQRGSEIIDEVAALLKRLFGIEHVTLQLERETLEKLQRPGETE